jgi:Ni/Co efflux regulator RcnB
MKKIALLIAIAASSFALMPTANAQVQHREEVRHERAEQHHEAIEHREVRGHKMAEERHEEHRRP